MNAFIAGLAVIPLFVTTAGAMPIYRFDQMSDNDDARYVASLVASAKAASQFDPALYARVKRFFQNKQPGETISGMGKFELNLAFARIADLQAVAKNPRVRRLEVEDVLYTTMVDNGITLPGNYRPAVFDFKPQEPPEKPVTMADAQQGLARTQNWIARTVERDSPALFSGFSSNDKVIAFWGTVIVAAMMMSKSEPAKTGGTPGPPYEPKPHCSRGCDVMTIEDCSHNTPMCSWY